MAPVDPGTYSLERALAWRCLAPEIRLQKQLGLVRRHLKQAACSPFYRELFGQCAFEPEHLGSLDDVRQLPLTGRKDLDANPAAFGVPEIHYADIAQTSGSTGEPVTVPYTVGDLERLAFNEMMAFYGAGVRPGDRLLLCVTLDRCFVAGLAYYSGLVRLGAAAIRSGPGQLARQWDLIERMKPMGLVGVPSFLLRLAQWAAKKGFEPHQAGIKTLVTIGEPIRHPDFSLTKLGQLLTEAWGCELFSSYGATEFETAFCECRSFRGGHVHPELMLVEIVDDEGRSLPDGQSGEVVVTPLGVQGFPLVRFRTGDVARLYTEPCACGWQTPRLGPVEGRLAQRLKYKGTTLYPEMIFHILQEIPAVKASYVEISSAFDLSDEICVVIGVQGQGITVDQVGDLLQARLRVRPKVLIRDANKVQGIMEGHGGRKVQRFFDLRVRV